MIDKRIFRNEIAAKKKSFSCEQLKTFSTEVMTTLESVDLFQKAQTVLAYYSIADEVNTHELIRKYSKTKKFILPVVSRNDLVLKNFISEEEMELSAYKILEPKGPNIDLEKIKIDLIIVPGVAFDRNLNRLGRGKGYYDRLLPRIKALKMGVCFDFQLVNSFQFNNDVHDVKMNMVVSQNEIIEK